jgi:hypothetical protein
MKEWRILLILEFEWRIFRLHRKLINWLVGKGVKLNSTILCLINRSLDNLIVILAENRLRYEQITGQIIQYYKRDEL